VVPAHITVAYVNAVFAKLDAVLGNAVREIIRTRELPVQAEFQLAAIYTFEQLKIELRIISESIHKDLSNVRTVPGDLVVRTMSIVSASPHCIFVRATTDFASVDKASKVSKENLVDGYYGLSRKTLSQDPEHLNPTPWAISATEVVGRGQLPTDPCS